MATGRRPDVPGGPEIPDLELGSRPARTAPAAPAAATRGPAQKPPSSGERAEPAPRTASSGDAQSYFGAGTFDSDHFQGSDVAIALDTDDAPAAARSAADYFGDGMLAPADDGRDLDTFETSAVNAQQARSSAPAPRPAPARKWPTATTPDPASLPVDEVEVALAAALGPAPANVALTPFYAARVLMRRRAIQERTIALRQRLVDSERERDELVVRMVQDLRGRILMTEEGERLFEPVAQLEKLALERRSALAGSNAEYDRRAQELAEQADALGRNAASKRAAIDERTTALAEQTRLFDRAEAKKKRLYIELRAIVEASEKAAGQMTPAQSARAAELEAQVTAQKPELDAATRARDAARSALAAAQEAEQQTARQLRDVERQRRALDQEFQKEIGTRSEGVSAADQRRFDALAATGRAVLATRGTLVEVPNDVLDALLGAEQTVRGRAIELEQWVRAGSAHDDSAFKTGLAVGAGAIALLVVALVLVLTLS